MLERACFRVDFRPLLVGFVVGQVSGVAGLAVAAAPVAVLPAAMVGREVAADEPVPFDAGGGFAGWHPPARWGGSPRPRELAHGGPARLARYQSKASAIAARCAAARSPSWG